MLGKDIEEIREQRNHEVNVTYHHSKDNPSQRVVRVTRKFLPSRPLKCVGREGCQRSHRCIITSIP